MAYRFLLGSYGVPTQGNLFQPRAMLIKTSFAIAAFLFSSLTFGANSISPQRKECALLVGYSLVTLMQEFESTDDSSILSHAEYYSVLFLTISQGDRPSRNSEDLTKVKAKLLGPGGKQFAKACLELGEREFGILTAAKKAALLDIARNNLALLRNNRN